MIIVIAEVEKCSKCNGKGSYKETCPLGRETWKQVCTKCEGLKYTLVKIVKPMETIVTTTYVV